MKVLIDNIIYNERTQEWTINMSSLLNYIDYSENNVADPSALRFGDFMNMNNNKPESFIIEIPYTDLVRSIDKIDELVRKEIKKKTTRDVKSFRITEVK